MAGPLMMMSEPGEPLSHKLSKEVTVNVWDRWEIQIERASGSLG